MEESDMIEFGVYVLGVLVTAIGCALWADEAHGIDTLTACALLWPLMVPFWIIVLGLSAPFIVIDRIHQWKHRYDAPR